MPAHNLAFTAAFTQPGSLNLLALDTSTEQLSLALQTSDGRTWLHEAQGGPQSSATLLPAIQALLQQAGLPLACVDVVVYGCGPGSFTGLRTTCAVAQGLTFGIAEGANKKPVQAVPVDSLTAIAEDARMRHGCERVVAALDARMNEVYTSRLTWAGGRWQHETDIQAMPPAAVQIPTGYVLAGNAHQVYAQEMAATPQIGCALPAMPRAAAMLQLAPALLAAGHGQTPEAIAPLYIRNKVALTTQEREQLKNAPPHARAGHHPGA